MTEIRGWDDETRIPWAYPSHRAPGRWWKWTELPVSSENCLGPFAELTCSLLPLHLPRNLVRSVHEQIEKDRTLKIMERERERRIQAYHRYLLSQKLPSVPEVYDQILKKDQIEGSLCGSARSERGSASTLQRAGLVVSMLSKLNGQTTEADLPKETPRTKIMSMSRPLGSRVKPFGQAQVAKNKKKKKKKAGSKAKKKH